MPYCKNVLTVTLEKIIEMSEKITIYIGKTQNAILEKIIQTLSGKNIDTLSE